MPKVRARVGLALTTAGILLATQVAALSNQHDRPDDVPPDPAPATPQGAETEAVETVTPANTFNDFISILNPSGTGISRLNLTSSEFAIDNNSWRVVNNADQNHRFEIRQTTSGADQNRMVIRQGGNVGFGVDNPLSPVHIVRAGGFQLRLATGGTADYRMDAFGSSLRIGHVSRPNQFRIFEAANNETLVVNEGIGVGTLTPEAELDIHNLGFDPSTRIAFSGTGGHRWVNAVRPQGHFAFNLVGTGGGEFVVRERHHANSTLDVDGPVRATEYKTVSSRKHKTSVRSVDSIDVLNKMAELPITSWRYRACEDGQSRIEGEDGEPPTLCTGRAQGPRHIGPMAEDFRRLFGGDGESVSLSNVQGILMASVKGLIEELEARDATIAELEDRLDSLEDRLASLESGSNGGPPATPPGRR
jgi:hypothetical protein